MVIFVFSEPKAVFQQDGICKSFLEIMEGYMVTREKHLSDNNEYRPGFSNAAPVFDPKQFKANREVSRSSMLDVISLLQQLGT